MNVFRKSKTKNSPSSPLILINRYNLKDRISIASSYRPKIESQLNYVQDLAPFSHNRKNKKRPKSTTGHPKVINHENVYRNYHTFKTRPSVLYSSKNRFAHPFTPEKTEYKTFFPFHYNQHLIPCHIYDKAYSFALIWDTPFDKIDYSKILIACFEGLVETKLPYRYISRQACKDLLLAPNAHGKIIPLLPNLFGYLRTALFDNNDETFLEACDIAEKLIFVADNEGLPYMKIILPPLQKRIFVSKYKEKVYNLLNSMVGLYGNQAFLCIKSVIPTYCPNTIIFS